MERWKVVWVGVVFGVVKFLFRVIEVGVIVVGVIVILIVGVL